eukprot:4352481-Amphidinium_carterae.1
MQAYLSPRYGGLPYSSPESSLISQLHQSDEVLHADSLAFADRRGEGLIEAQLKRPSRIPLAGVVGKHALVHLVQVKGTGPTCSSCHAHQVCPASVLRLKKSPRNCHAGILQATPGAVQSHHPPSRPPLQNRLACVHSHRNHGSLNGR